MNSLDEDRGDGDVAGGDGTAEGQGSRSSTVKKWVSVAIEGPYDAIQNCIKSAFGGIFDALKAGYEANVPILLAGYPTFVANQDLHALSIQSSSLDAKEAQSAENKRYNDRLAEQRQQVGFLLQYIEAQRVSDDKVVG